MFEDSLWDLKRRDQASVWFFLEVWRFPMGFETNELATYMVNNLLVWRFPMGFETFSAHHDCSLPRVWRFPMGFETTCALGAYCFFECLKIPYGMWNMSFSKVMISSIIRLKIPYGIWNQLCSGLIMLKLCLKIPYGIWNSTTPISVSCGTKFEDSLWDLKQNCPFLVFSFSKGLKIPYGIWNPQWPHTKMLCRF